MGSGGGAAQPSTQTVTQTNLPEYARPYFENLMGRAQAESYRPYEAYQGQRIAPLAPGQTDTQQQIMGLQAPGQFGQASSLASQAGLGALSGGQYTPGQFTSSNVNAPSVTTGSFIAPGTASQYMSPYMQNVVDVQKQQAIEDAQKAQLTQNLGAARQGTYGGTRQLLATMEREKALQQQLGNIQATGSQSAYDAAMKAFEAEQGRNLQAQQLGGQFGMQAALANQQAGLQAQQMGEQSRQFGSNLGLQGLSQALQGAQTLGQLGSAQQQSDLQRLQAQYGIGSDQRTYEQQMLDQQYADFLRQRDYPMEQLGYYSNILRGLPIGLNSTATAYAQPPSTMAQIGGLGLAGLGMYNMMR